MHASLNSLTPFLPNKPRTLDPAEAMFRYCQMMMLFASVFWLCMSYWLGGNNPLEAGLRYGTELRQILLGPPCLALAVLTISRTSTDRFGSSGTHCWRDKDCIRATAPGYTGLTYCLGAACPTEVWLRVKRIRRDVTNSVFLLWPRRCGLRYSGSLPRNGTGTLYRR